MGSGGGKGAGGTGDGDDTGDGGGNKNGKVGGDVEHAATGGVEGSATDLQIVERFGFRGGFGASSASSGFGVVGTATGTAVSVLGNRGLCEGGTGGGSWLF